MQKPFLSSRAFWKQANNKILGNGNRIKIHVWNFTGFWCSQISAALNFLKETYWLATYNRYNARWRRQIPLLTFPWEVSRIFKFHCFKATSSPAGNYKLTIEKHCNKVWSIFKVNNKDSRSGVYIVNF